MMITQYLIDAGHEVTIPGVEAPKSRLLRHGHSGQARARAGEAGQRTDRRAGEAGTRRGRLPGRAVHAVVHQGAGRGGLDDVGTAEDRRTGKGEPAAWPRSTWPASRSATAAPTRPHPAPPAERCRPAPVLAGRQSTDRDGNRGDLPHACARREHCSRGTEDLLPNKRGDHPPNGCTRRDCTLREAIDAANAHPGPDRVGLKPGRPYRLAIAGRAEDLNATGDLDVTGPLTISSAGRRRAAIDAAGVDRAIDAFARLTVSRLKITGGLSDLDAYNLGGAGIRSGAGHSLTVLGCVIAGNRDLSGYTGVGGGIARSGVGKLVIRRSTIRNNSAGLAAGGIFDGGSNSHVLIADSRILHNTSRPPYGYATGFDEFGDNTVVRMATLVRATEPRTRAAGSGSSSTPCI